ncbi:MAG: 3-oxoacyl-ACP synthase, partial [Chloroflexi bacterium]|nr:3-oxoacyl-ACP synthase [Chloroflexota bacterium]
NQANLRSINGTAKALGIPAERVMLNVDRYGNTSSASIPIALREAWEQDRLHDGDRLLLVSVGGGLAWGALVLEWVPLGPVPVAAGAARIASGS